MHTKAEAPEKEPLSLGQSRVALSGVSRTYAAKRSAVRALEGIDLELREREVVAVVGPSGCGKSTLLELVAGLQEPDVGAVSVGGRQGAAERRPATLTVPASGSWSPATSSSSVDLPQPEGPTTASTSRSPTARSTPSSALTSWPRRRG